MTKSWKTKLIHSDAKIPQGYRSLATPVYRGSTTVFPSAAAVRDTWDQFRVGYTYGLYGTPTALELAARICELESGDAHHPHSRRTGRHLSNQFRSASGGRSHPAFLPASIFPIANSPRACSRDSASPLRFTIHLIGCRHL